MRRRRLTVLNTRAEHDRLVATLTGLGKPVISRVPYEIGVKISIVTNNACAPGGQFVAGQGAAGQSLRRPHFATTKAAKMVA